MVEISQRIHKRRVDSANVNSRMTGEALRQAKCSTSKTRNASRLAFRRFDADQRNLEWNLQTNQQKLYSLDERLGKDEGAKKQRLRIALAMLVD